ncbi:hypothetical protein BDN72DRAFT_680416 [Pluteus cervinus]|uniref:Uncharacterized protein n=1 Tax=Pluteus cervinus TaxID=181527 RepID=A0ACD3AR66_9AGAR|nr:hypothetical protein BDN72DRAFT_680416 [Pluteus cervinus]
MDCVVSYGRKRWIYIALSGGGRTMRGRRSMRSALSARGGWATLRTGATTVGEEEKERAQGRENEKGWRPNQRDVNFTQRQQPKTLSRTPATLACLPIPAVDRPASSVIYSIVRCSVFSILATRTRPQRPIALRHPPISKLDVGPPLFQIRLHVLPITNPRVFPPRAMHLITTANAYIRVSCCI